MRALRIVAGAVILLGTITACGSSNQGAPANAPDRTSTSPTTDRSSTVIPPPGSSTPPSTGLPPGATPVPKERVDTGAVPSLPEPPQVAAAPDGRTLTLTVMARDSCSGVEATVTEETADAVKIELTPMLQPQGGPPDQVCAQVLTPRQVTVQLREPLGSRKVFISEAY
ncbi:MAG TPA: hypothetical protein VGX25_20875 [Actinophytocola sp.]|uniref:hypothetical protein n=1 Tax=Actinophytocola sp. TaxID=1872138 RepID=UPI002DDD5FA4|nr:hypothetical protein [Actinophytocola sp.]HEV2781848.1 hypothetical protein [Actinophytocola sp.]